MNKKIALLVICSAFTLEAKESGETFGSVNYEKCMSESLYAKQQKTQIENIGKRLQDLLNNTEAELNATTEKLENSEYTEALTAQGLKELSDKKETLTEELARHRQQLYQTARQLQQNASRVIHNATSKAAEKIAEERALKCVVPRDTVFFCDKGWDITDSVIKEMDRAFKIEKEQNEQQVKKDMELLENESNKK